MTHLDVINKLITRFEHKSYLEIGIDDQRVNYDKVICEHKEGVDPAYTGKDTTIHAIGSDDFFKQNKTTFDIIFIDGLHEHEQVIRDIDNSLRVLNKNGIIVVHDTMPYSEIMQRVPREQVEWTGDVWKAILHFRKNKDLSILTVDIDYGVTLIKPGKQKTLRVKDISYDEFTSNMHKYVNAISSDDFNKICE